MAQFFRDLRDRSKALDVNMTDQEIDELKKRNNRRLKRAFDDIIEKYSRDFESTGDEIDLEKEEIVVNNGHILHMQHDRDAGKGKKARRLLTSLATGEGWDEDALDDYVRSSDAETEETEEAIGGSHLLGSDKDADGETEEDSEDDLAEKGDRSSVSRTNSEPSFRTNPTSAEDSNVTPQAEDSDSGFDPLSIDEYTASTQRKQAKHRASAAPPIQHLAKRRRQAPVESPVFTETACEPSEIPTEQDPVSTRTTENTPDVVEDSNSRPQKKRRGGPILEIPVWNRPDMPSNIPLPKTAWDYHWSRRRNPANRTFDEEGNQITTWKEIQTRRRQEKRGMIMPPMATTQNAGVEGKKRGVDATRRIVEGEPTVKLEHMCLSDDVASVCPACEQEALMGTTDGLSYADDDAIIDPEVADTLLKGHTCLSADIASPCAACEREQDTQGEDEEVDFVGTDKDKQPDPDRSGWRGSPAQISNVNDGTDWETTSGSDIDSDFDDDWENNPDLPPPQYVTKIVKYYNRRRQFTFEEDQTILRIIEDEGKSWYEVMEALPHCSKGQLQYRYYNELRSTQWRERQAAAREASKHAKRAEIDKRKQQKWLERASIRSVRDLAGSVFERPLKKSDPQWKEQIQDEDFKLRPLDPCILPEPLPEEARPSPTFHPTVPLIELIKLDDQTDSARLPIWPQAPMLPAQIEGVPMEPIPPLSLLYETPYPDVYANAQYKDGRDDNDSGNASEVELEPEENAFDNLPVGLFEGPSHSGTSAGPSYSQLSAFGFPPQQSGYSLPPSLGICTLPCCQPAQSVPSFAPTPQPPQPDVQQSPPTTIPVAPQYILRQLPAPGSRRSGFENASSSIVQQYSPFPMLSTPITALDASSSRPSTASTRPSTPFAPSPIYPGLSRWPTLADLMVQTQNAISGQQTPNPALTRPSTANSIAVNPQDTDAPSPSITGQVSTELQTCRPEGVDKSTATLKTVTATEFKPTQASNNPAESPQIPSVSQSYIPTSVADQPSQRPSTAPTSAPDAKPTVSPLTESSDSTSQRTPDPYAHFPPHLRPHPQYLAATQQQPIHNTSHQRLVANKYAIAAKGAATRRARAGLKKGNEKYLDKMSGVYYRSVAEARRGSEESGEKENTEPMREDVGTGGNVEGGGVKGAGVVGRPRSVPNGGLPLGVQRVVVVEKGKERGRWMAVDKRGLDDISPDGEDGGESSESDGEVEVQARMEVDGEMEEVDLV